VPYYTTKEVATIFDCTPENVFYMIKKGKLHPVGGKSRIFKVSEVTKFLFHCEKCDNKIKQYPCRHCGYEEEEKKKEVF